MSTSALELRQAIQQALAAFGHGPLVASATTLFETLGYRSAKRLLLEPPPGESPAATFSKLFGEIDAAKALTADWRSVDMVFQLTDAEIRDSAQIGLFDSSTQYDGAIINAYLVLALELTGASYTRSQLADITRAVNQRFAMPVLIVFKYDALLTLALIKRRLNLRDSARDVLEKVTLIKDVRYADPHRAHIEILYDMALPQLAQRHRIHNFVSLQAAWMHTLDSSELNKRFFNELANWYFWAVDTVRFPADAGDAQSRNQISVIRLITRVMFIWFLREKQLIPAELFRKQAVAALLQGDDPSRYYKAILQNLFFATLNQEMDKRAFRRERQHYNTTTLYRYQRFFRDPDAILALFAPIPFLNGGLFECLDQHDQQLDRVLRVDGFSDRPDNDLFVPDPLFWADTHTVDLNSAYNTKGKAYKVRGLIPLLDAYKFTITENTPLEEEIALDPELLGKVFENLLASYNEETRDTARKQTGSFYTPREVVDFMVDEALLLVFAQALTAAAKLTADIDAAPASLDRRLRELLSYAPRPASAYLSETEIQVLTATINDLALLDPACGSGAFPMGALQKLVHILSKLDPHNQRWKQRQEERASKIDDPEAREAALDAIQEAFEHNELDYGRKLFLIENVIFGVDIQPIAVQIAKLRFFIALIVDQKVDAARPNRGVRPLPNLETKFVAANALRDVGQLGLRTKRVELLEAELERVRRDYFNAKTPRTKHKYRQRDEELRQELRQELETSLSVNPEQASMLANWDPYNQNRFADFFSAEWMFGREAGFDIIIGNPPYVRQEKIKPLKEWLQQQYDTYTGVADLYVYFFERGLKLLKRNGVLCFISSNKYFRARYGAKLRQHLASTTSISRLIDFGDAPVFTAIAYPSIIVASKQPPAADSVISALNWQPDTPVEEFPALARSAALALPQQALAADGWRIENRATLDLLERLRQSGTPLGEYVNGRFYYGIKTGLNAAFVVDQATRDQLITEHPSSAQVLKPFLRGRDVKRWSVNFAEQYLIRIESSENTQHPWSDKPLAEAERIFAATYPAIQRWLSDFRDALIKRADQGRYFWELRSCAYWQEFEQPKILYPDIAKVQQFTADTNGYFTADTTFFMPLDKKWVLGVLNSSVVLWFYDQISSQVRGGYLRFKTLYVSQIPIPAADPSERELIEVLVEYVIYLTGVVGDGPPPGSNLVQTAGDSAMLGYFERLIDVLVYELFFPDALAAARCQLFAPLLAAELPPLAALGAEPLPTLRAIYARLYDPEHPARKSLFFLDRVAAVRIIEGKE